MTAGEGSSTRSDDDGVALPESLAAGLRPVSPQSASVVATDSIRKAIMEGHLPPGSRLKEEELARQLQISRTPVRHALNILAGEGLIVLAPNRGAVVRTYTAAELEEVYQLRSLLEGHGARLAADRISDEDLRDLKESCERFAHIRETAGDDIRGLVEENLTFHGLILKAASSQWLSSFVRRITNLSLVQSAYWLYSPELRLNSEHCHRQIVRAVENRDGERAELIMKGHILEAKDFLIDMRQAP
jgi:DNA-binding GntR family transcriptional regulator